MIKRVAPALGCRRDADQGTRPMDVSYCSIDIVDDSTEFSTCVTCRRPVRMRPKIKAASGNGAKRLLSGRLMSTRKCRP
ncbi:hypothetical protein MPL3365_170079 [Mesorhizobium plurifarium]|uniref:Uncharacterized protein n=1 Tax=Mesorhizobium plurifarium TaxID=69974 RepID=A0A090FZ26_MESPL|nr:hypothetical protein MPL3365_170079 [Mesorhizobium plurifarium]